jgi:hypothetical protein
MGAFIRPGDLPAQRQKLLESGSGKAGEVGQSNLCNTRGRRWFPPNWAGKVGMRNVFDRAARTPVLYPGRRPAGVFHLTFVSALCYKTLMGSFV